MKDQAYQSIMHAWMEEDLESAMTHMETLPTGRSKTDLIQQAG